MGIYECNYDDYDHMVVNLSSTKSGLVLNMLSYREECQIILKRSDVTRLRDELTDILLRMEDL